MAVSFFGLAPLAAWTTKTDTRPIRGHCHTHRIDTRRPIATAADCAATDHSQSRNRKMADCPRYY